MCVDYADVNELTVDDEDKQPGIFTRSSANAFMSGGLLSLSSDLFISARGLYTGFFEHTYGCLFIWVLSVLFLNQILFID